MSYNGWQNYETWLAGLYLNAFSCSNGVDWQNFVETKLLGGEKGKEITEDKKAAMLAEYFKNFIDDWLEEEAGMAGLNDFLYDLLTSAISEIDFTELATTFLDD